MKSKRIAFLLILPIVFSGLQNRKINASGTVDTIVKDIRNSKYSSNPVFNKSIQDQLIEEYRKYQGKDINSIPKITVQSTSEFYRVSPEELKEFNLNPEKFMEKIKKQPNYRSRLLKSSKVGCAAILNAKDPVQTGPVGQFPPQPDITRQMKLKCQGLSFATDASLRLAWKYSTVNQPKVLIPYKPDDFDTCGLIAVSQECIPAPYTISISGAKHLWTTMSVSVKDPINGFNFVTDLLKIEHFNDRGYAYPSVTYPEGRFIIGAELKRYNFSKFNPPKLVPFPSPPFDRCADNPNLVPTCPRGDRVLLKATRDYYKRHRYKIPSTPYEGHHIKPLCVGGSDKNGSNGVLLSNLVHKYFTFWWGNRPVAPNNKCGYFTVR